MSLKKVDEVKADKGFKIWDLVIYGAIAALVVALFIALFETRDSSPLKGIQISVKGEVVYEYDFEKGEVSRADCVQTQSEEGSLITLRVEAGGGYNIIEVNKNGWVRVTDADCSSKDCVYTPKITDSGGIIYCHPHALRIIPYDYDIDNGTLIQ